MDDLELDFDRFIYEKSETLAGDVHYARVGCYHRDVMPVRSVITNRPVAMLCMDCDEQLPVMKGMP